MATCRRCNAREAMPGDPLCGVCDEEVEEDRENQLRTIQRGPIVQPPALPPPLVAIQKPGSKPRVQPSRATPREMKERIRLAAMSAVEEAKKRPKSPLCAATKSKGGRCGQPVRFGEFCVYHKTKMEKA